MLALLKYAGWRLKRYLPSAANNRGIFLIRHSLVSKLTNTVRPTNYWARQCFLYLERAKTLGDSLNAQELLQEMQSVTQKHQATFSADKQDDLDDATTMLAQKLIKIHEHGNSTARILKDMQKLFKEHSSTFVNTDLNVYLPQQINACFSKALANYPSLPVQLDLQLVPQPLPVNLLLFEFGEVLASLVDNACYTLAEKSRRVKGFDPWLDVSTQLVDDQAQLQVRDNGRGIPQKEANQLFNPFFTTKPTAKGTGLGLYMSKEVVEYLHGQMRIDSVEEQYTQVTILLPLKTELITS